MKLPHFENAYVPQAKVTDYLLNLDHKGGGKDKAIFFMRFGFTSVQWQKLANALLAHAKAHEVASVVEKSGVTNYTIEGVLETPDGRNPYVRTVWTVEIGSDAPRFVTAYPLQDH